MKITSKESTYVVGGLFCLVLHFLMGVQSFEALVNVKGVVDEIKESYNSVNLSVKLCDRQTRIFKVSLNKTDVIRKIELLKEKEVTIWYSEEYELAYGVIELWQLSHNDKIVIDYKDMVYKTKLVKTAVLFIAISFFIIVLLRLLTSTFTE